MPPYADYASARVQQCFSGNSAGANRRVMLITFVQSVIGTHNKDFSPFNQRGRKKPSDRAENHLLEKSRLHVDLSSTPSAIVGCPCFPSNRCICSFTLRCTTQSRKRKSRIKDLTQ